MARNAKDIEMPTYKVETVEYTGDVKDINAYHLRRLQKKVCDLENDQEVMRIKLKNNAEKLSDIETNNKVVMVAAVANMIGIVAIFAVIAFWVAF